MGILRKFNLNSFERSTMVVFALSLVASMVNYLFQIIIGKILGTSDYGTANVILAYVSYLGVFFGPISVMACQYSAMYGNDGNTEKLNLFVNWIIKYSILIEIIIFFVGIGVAYVLKLLCGETVFYHALFIVLLLPTNSFYSIILSVIQGMQKFTLHGIMGIVFNGMKLIASVLFIIVGWDTTGIVLGLLCSQIVCILICFLVLRKHIWVKKNSPIEYWSSKNLFEYYGKIFVSQVFYFFYINGGDVIILKIFFDSDVVGLYSSAITLGKIVFYVVTPIMTVLFPIVAEKRGRGEKTESMLAKALVYACGISVVFLVMLNILGKYIIPILYGEEFNGAVNYLMCSSVYTLALIVLTVLYQYQLGIGEVETITKTLVLVNILACVAIGGFHSTPQGVIYLMGVMLLTVSFYVLCVDFRKRESFGEK